MERQALKLTGIAGIVFALGSIVAAFVIPGPPPSPDDSAGDFLEFVADGRTALLISAVTSFLITTPTLLFLAGYRQVTKTEGVNDLLAFASAAALAVYVTIALFTATLLGGTGYSEGNGLTAELARVLVFITSVGFLSMSAAVAGITLPIGVSIIRAHTFGRWFGYSALVIGAINLVATMCFSTSDLFQPLGLIPVAGTTLFYIWIIALSVGLLRRKA